MSREDVVLLDDMNRPCGVAPKQSVHDSNTPLHLAFSCYIFNPAGELLVTRRALSKRAWPGVWSNSACGHPLPGESLVDAVRRRCQYELGLPVEQIEMLLSSFSYRATDASGVVENEFCPVFQALACDTPKPLDSEVMDYRWTDPQSLLKAALATPWVFSPWMIEQLAALAEAGVGWAMQSPR